LHFLDFFDLRLPPFVDSVDGVGAGVCPGVGAGVCPGTCACGFAGTCAVGFDANGFDHVLISNNENGFDIYNIYIPLQNKTIYTLEHLKWDNF